MLGTFLLLLTQPVALAVVLPARPAITPRAAPPRLQAGLPSPDLLSTPLPAELDADAQALLETMAGERGTPPVHAVVDPRR